MAAIRVRVWDVPVRLVHWALVALLGFSWWSAEVREMAWHMWSGLAICALVVFRLLWGVMGSSTARFGGFVSGPRAVISYLTSAGPWRGTGHNPVGGWSVVALLALLAVQVTTGLFAVDVDGIESGPLSFLVDFDQGRAAAGIHETSFNILMLLSIIHVVAIAVYLIAKRRNLVTPMLTGSTADAHAEPSQALVPAPLWRLGAALTIAGFSTYAIARGFQF